MSMEDILKVLVDSRQQGGAQQGADPMASLIGGLLGGAQSQSHAPVNPNASGADSMANLVGSLLGGTQAPANSNAGSGATDLSGMMGMLEMFMGGQGGSTGSAANDPIMALISPFVPALAKKANISPEIAMIVISFVVHKLLAHHPTSGRDSNSFNFDDMLGQMSTGKVDPNLLHQSGMVAELSKKTGMDEAQTEQALQLAFTAVGKTVSKMGGSAKPSSAGTKAKPASGKSLGSSGAKQGKKIDR